MTAKNRATLIGKLHTALKKHFKPAPPSPGRPLMEHVLYASLLEDTPTDLADEGFAKCEQDFFDWNEVRVTTVTELAEVLSRLPSPTDASIRLKRNLQSMFEAFYNFDIDFLKKENLGKAIAKFEAMPGISPFVLSYLIQHGLGGHAIPVDKSAMKLMWLAGIVSDAEAESGKVPGLERTIPKNKAIEFSSLLHQAGVAFQHNPKDKAVWDVLLSLNKDAKAMFDRPAVPVKEPKKSVAAKEVPAPAPAKPTKGSLEKKPTVAPVPEAKTTDAVKSKSSTDKSTSTKSASAKSATLSEPKSAKPVAAASKSASDKATSGGQSPSAKAVKGSSSKPVSTKKPTSTAHAPGKASSKPTTDKAKKPSVKKSEPVSPVKATSAKPASSKPASSKTSSVKPPSAKTPTSKPLSEKTPSKPASKKSSTSKLVPEKKAIASTNKKLTKQKPR